MNMNQRKMKILDAAHILFVEKGFNTTSIQDILDEAKISKGTFYNYFSSKNECLLAILEQVQEEGDQERIEFALGKAKEDEEVFIQQLAIRFNMNRKHNMLALFNAVMHSEDPEIRKYLDKNYRLEMHWIAKRMNEVYSPGTADYSLDHAVMLLGMIHHYLQVWKMGTKEEIGVEGVIRFLLSQMKPIIQEYTETREIFFPKNWLRIELDEVDSSELNSHIVGKIDSLVDSLRERGLSNQLDYLLFLKKEITTGSPRDFIVESMILSLTHLFDNTEFQHEMRQLVSLVEKYIK